MVSGCNRSKGFPGQNRPFLRKDKLDSHVRNIHPAAPSLSASSAAVANAILGPAGNSDDVLQPSADDLPSLINNGNSTLYNARGAQLGSTTNFSGSSFEEELVQPINADMLTTSMGWFDYTLPAVAKGNEDLAGMLFTSVTGMTDWEWNNIPSATTEFFSPSDLLLVPDPSKFVDYAQPISNSGKPSYQSAPALTASSFGAQSETTPSKAMQRKSQLLINNYPFDGIAANHNHNLSESTTVPASAAADKFGIDAGHLANLASLSSSQTLPELYDNDNISNLEPLKPSSIMIPVVADDPSDYYCWNFTANTPATSAGQYAWLQQD